MNISANCLFHITPEINYLISILENGFYPRYCIEEVGFFTAFAGFDKVMVAQPMVCFCDIPLSSMKAHVEKYGYFGIGMDKTWGRAKAISPVTYVYPHSATGDLLRFISFKTLLLYEERHEQFFGLMMILKNYYKAIEGHMYKEGKFGSEIFNFYDEREWRYIPFNKIEELAKDNPTIKSFLEKEVFDDLTLREQHNTLISNPCALKFNPTDIKYLFVKADSDLEILTEYIEKNYMRGKSSREITSLISKIIVLERLLQDM